MKLQKIVLALGLALIFDLALGQCPPPNGGDFDGDLTVTGTCIVNGDLILKKKNLTISSTGSLTINGNFDNDGNGTITIDGGEFDVSGYFNNNGNGVVNVLNEGSLDVGTNYFNNGNGTTNFGDGSIAIGGSYTNDGNGNIDAGGTVSIAGDFTVSGNGINTISGGLSVGGTADLGSGGIDIMGGGVLQADEVVSEGAIDIDQGGTINVTSGNITGTVNNDPANADQDCTNNCCGDFCNVLGDNLSDPALEVLPIELLYFTATSTHSGVSLEWASATEINNDFYTIERSYDGYSFIDVKTIDGAGTSTAQIDYSTLDYPRYSGRIYYRLIQTDYDGTFEAFSIVSVLHQPDHAASPKIYPTSLRSGSVVNIDNSWGQINEISLFLHDLSGRNSKKVDQMSITDKVKFGTEGVASGSYLLSGHINGISINQRLIIYE